MSLTVCCSSAANGPRLVVATRLSAASKPMPDATQIVIWSMVSDTAPLMASWRLERWLETQNRGARNPTAAPKRAKSG